MTARRSGAFVCLFRMIFKIFWSALAAAQNLSISRERRPATLAIRAR
jgi:hypothetical protein